MHMGDYELFIASLASLGEVEVGAKLAQGVWANEHKSWAEQWLRAKVAEREAENAMASIATAREANVIAASNARSARSAKSAAWVAALAAVVAEICAVLVIAAHKH
jgi:hypothetical protein